MCMCASQVEAARDAKNDVRDGGAAWATYRQLLRAYSIMLPLLDAAAADCIAPDGSIAARDARPHARAAVTDVVGTHEDSSGEQRQAIASVGAAHSGAEPCEDSVESSAEAPGNERWRGEQRQLGAHLGLEPVHTCGAQVGSGAEADTGLTASSMGKDTEGSDRESGRRKLGYTVDMDAAGARLEGEL
jgi:hypothetical protein